MHGKGGTTMGMLDRERAWQFNIRIDGEVRGHIVQCGPRWRLRRTDLENAPGYDGIDVTAVLDRPEAIAAMLRDHLARA